MAADIHYKPTRSTNAFVFWFRGMWHWSLYNLRENLTSPIALIFDVFYAPAIVVVGSLTFAKQHMATKIFLTSGMVFLALLASAVVSLAGIIVSHKERHLLKRFRATPLPTSALITGFFLGVAWTSLISAILCYLVGHEWFSIPWPHEIVMSLVAWLGALVSTSLISIIISSLVRRTKSVMSLTMPLFFVLIGVSGLFWPMKLSPKWLQIASWFLPTRPASDWFLHSATQSSFVHLYSWEPWLLLGWIIVLAIIAIRFFQWD